jgi:hypothetical protein
MSKSSRQSKFIGFDTIAKARNSLTYTRVSDIKIAERYEKNNGYYKAKLRAARLLKICER